MNYRADIQGLRAIAVLFVFFFHLVPSAMPGGFIGVDVFFVISGYIITSIILHKKDKNNFSFLDFYIGRYKRIVPLYYVILIAILMGAVFIYIPTDIYRLKSGTFWSVLFLSNNYLSNLDTYFGATSTENPLLHTWTLSIEMQFYFLLPIIVIFLPKKRISLVLTFLSILLIAYSFYSSTYLGKKSEMYFSLLARIPEFFIGSLSAVHHVDIKRLGPRLIRVISIVGLSGLFVCGFYLSEVANFPGLWVLIPCLATAFILINEDSALNRRILSGKFLVHLGQLSYSIYLVHWPIMAFVRYYFGRLDFSFTEMILITISTYLLSLLTYNIVESYFRKLEIKRFILRFGIVVLSLPLIYLKLPIPKAAKLPDIYTKPSFGLDSHGRSFKHVGYYGDVSQECDSILLIGDSHAMVYAGILHNVGRKNGFNFRAITNNRYPIIPGISKDDFTEDDRYRIYLSLLDSVKSEIKRAKVIVLASLWYEEIKSLPYALDSFLTSIDSTKIIIVLQDYPMLDKNPIRVNKSFIKRPEINNRYKATVKSIPKEIKNVLNKASNVYFLEISYFEYFDDLPFYRDTLMYYDEGHLNYYGSTKVAEKIEEEFMHKFNKILDERN